MLGMALYLREKLKGEYSYPFVMLGTLDVGVLILIGIVSKLVKH